MNAYIKTNVQFKFGRSERPYYVEIRLKKLYIQIATKLIHVKFRHTCMYNVHALTHVKAPYFAVRM